MCKLHCLVAGVLTQIIQVPLDTKHRPIERRFLYLVGNLFIQSERLPI